MSGHNCLQLIPCFAGQDAFVPRVTKFCATDSSAIPKPRTVATATTSFARFVDSTASGANESASRRRHCRGCRCSYVRISQRKCLIILLCLLSNAICLGLTFAGLQAFKPPVFHISVASSSAVLEPSTAGSTTTISAGFLKRTTLLACQR